MEFIANLVIGVFVIGLFVGFMWFLMSRPDPRVYKCPHDGCNYTTINRDMIPIHETDRHSGW